VPLILPVSFPDPPDVPEGEEHRADLDLLRHWNRAPENPTIFAKAGADFALTSFRLRDEADFARKLREAIARGLAPDRMFEALTVAPARMLGVSDRLGRIAPGMLAFLTVTDGPPCRRGDDGQRPSRLERRDRGQSAVLKLRWGSMPSGMLVDGAPPSWKRCARSSTESASSTAMPTGSMRC